MKSASVITISSGLLILLWVYTATSKLLDQATFQYTLEKAPYIGQWHELLVVGVPLLELGLAVLLLSVRGRRHGLIGSAALLLLFTLYISVSLVAAKDLPCSCGGIISSMGWGEHLLFNLAMVGIALAGLYQFKKPSLI